MDKYSTFAYRNLGLIYLQQGKLERATSALCKAVTFSSGGLAFEGYLGFAYAVAGRQTEAMEALASLQEMAKERYVSAYQFAMIYLGLGETDKAVEWLEKAFEERSGFMPFLKVEPMFDLLRADLRFQELLRKVGFPQ